MQSKEDIPPNYKVSRKPRSKNFNLGQQPIDNGYKIEYRALLLGFEPIFLQYSYLRLLKVLDLLVHIIAYTLLVKYTLHLCWQFLYLIY